MMREKRVTGMRQRDAGRMRVTKQIESMRRSLAVVALLAIAAVTLAADLPSVFDPRRDGAADVAHAVALAKAQGKWVIVDVGGEWCTWCHVLDRFVAANDDVRDAIDAHYVWVKVNFSKENENSALLARWPKVAGYPHLFVLDSGGRVVLSQDTEELERGHSYDKARFLAFLAKGASSSPTRAAESYGPTGLVGRPTYVF
jgi:thiol:disulfide interchange protein